MLRRAKEGLIKRVNKGEGEASTHTTNLEGLRWEEMV